MSDTLETHSLDWSELIDAARGGCDVALGQIVARLRGYLLAVADQGLGDGLRAKFGASDVVQQSLLEAHESIGQFHGSSEGELRLWLRRIVLHNLVDSARRYTATQARNIGQETSLETLPRFERALVNGDPTASWQLQRKEVDLQLLDAIGRLPARQRRVVELRHRWGRSYAEIARELDTTEASVRKLWSRAVGQLKCILGNHSADVDDSARNESAANHEDRSTDPRRTRPR